ncbi:efflux RND transporter periplasmic adaptor subunit, partial [Pseudomonas sp. AH2 (2023)]
AHVRVNELSNIINSYGGSGNGMIEVRAAMSGTVLEILSAIGTNVNPSTPMFKIANTSQLLAVVNIPADKLNVVKTSNKVTIQSQT